MEKRSKLIRDKIGEKITKEEKTIPVHIANAEEYKVKLKEKLQEELQEYLLSEDPEELADMLEVIDALAELQNLSKEDLEKIRQKKAQEKGTFKKKFILDKI
ncbi:MAG: nucleoside triphosphate pyrophosphohydrolase, partial [Candidatus Woesearchaeota archaeon]|nr:nucleoside triphosphate pyrophosphohydrolase [Candidatus Woesearchaeota archaeon]